MNPSITITKPFMMPLTRAEVRALATEVAAIPKRKLAEVLAKAKTGIETLTGAESKTLRELIALAMSMTRRSFIKIVSTSLPMLGFSPKPPSPVSAEKAILAEFLQLNDKSRIINHMIQHHFDIGEDLSMINNLDALRHKDVSAASGKQAEYIKTLAISGEIRRIVQAVRSKNFSVLQSGDWGTAARLSDVFANKGHAYFDEGELSFLLKHIIPRTGLVPADMPMLKRVLDYCADLSYKEPVSRTKTKIPLTPFNQYLVTTAAGAEEARTHYEQTVEAYQPEAPERGD